MTSIGLTIVIPVLDEEATLEELIGRCLAVGDGLGREYEIILVDDGSRDRSPRLIEAAAAAHPGVVVGVFLNRNYGQHAAVLAGFERARGEAVATLDADLQNPPEEIAAIVAELDAGADVVGSVRVPRNDSVFRRAASAVVNRMVRAATGVNMHDYGSMLRGYRRRIVDAVLACHERSTFIPVLANSFARKTAEIEVRHEPRRAGASKYGVLNLINLQFDLLTSMTTFPLRALSMIGGVLSLAGIGFGVLLLVLRLVLGPEWAAEGVFTLMAVLFFFIGAQFLAMGLLGEYIGRMYHDVRARPRYFIERVVDASGGEHRRPGAAAAAPLRRTAR